MKQEKINSEFEELLKGDIALGREVIKSPWDDYRVPKDIKVRNVEYKGLYFDSMQPGDNYKPSLDYALEGVHSLDDHLKDVNFFPDAQRKTPEIQVEVPFSLQDLETPVLGSYSKHPKVVVKPVRDLGTLHFVSGDVFYEVHRNSGSLLVSANGLSFGKMSNVEEYAFSNLPYKYTGAILQTIKYPMLMSGHIIKYPHILFETKGKKKRGVKTIANPAIDVIRYPIVFNADLGNRLLQVSKFAELAYEILLNQLEPSITDKILQSVKNIGYNISEKQYDEVVRRMISEGGLIGRAIVREWLLAINRNRFKREEIKKWRAYSPDQDKEELALIQAGLKGPSEIVRYYKGSGWNPDKFLKGEF